MPHGHLIFSIFSSALQFLLLQPKVDQGEPEGTTIMELSKDPYILVAAGSITIGNLGIAMLGACFCYFINE